MHVKLAFQTFTRPSERNIFSLWKIRGEIFFWKNTYYSTALENQNTVKKALNSKTKITRPRKNDQLYLNDPTCAEIIATSVCKDFKEGFICEANPGNGIFSKAVLKKGVRFLRAFEKNDAYHQLLKELCTEYSNFEVFHDDIFHRLLCIEARKSYTNEIDKVFQGFPSELWEKGVPFRLFSVVSDRKSIKFLRFLLAVLPTKSSIFTFGRCELFLLLSEPEYKYMKAEPKENFTEYRWSTVLYNIFFEIEYLHKFSSDIFSSTPMCDNKKVKGEFYLTRLTPKENLFTEVIYQNKLQDFYFFIRQHLVKRTALVIPTLENWIPLCGPRLIKEGMTVFTKFGDLSPSQLLHLFNQFSSWPEYEISAFQIMALRKYVDKSSNPSFFHEDNVDGS